MADIELRGNKQLRVHMHDVLMRTYRLALEDEKAPVSARVAVIDLVRQNVAHEHDVRLHEVDGLAVDIMPVRGDESFAWDVELVWVVWCDECEFPAIKQSRYSSNLCTRHFDESMEMDRADLEGDDIRAGMRP